TNGGDEYCGTVIQQAVGNLAWSASADDLKTIFIAGNEPFTQGNVDYRVSCKAAIERGVMVNTLFCGPHQEGIDTQWKDGAVLADGSYISIDQNQVVEHIEAPQDKAIAALGEAMNKTYIPYGAAGAEGMINQEAQDTNATSWGKGTMVQRARTKASGQYVNAGWDLVDAVVQKLVKLEDVKTEDLPEAMRQMTMEEKEKLVAEKANERQEIQKKIMDLDKQRLKYVAEKRKEKAEASGSTFDSAVIGSIQKMAEKRNFKNETDSIEKQ
ncbi:MAG: VWA domain-containing protein, partial [Planctomycetota bacterium]